MFAGVHGFVYVVTKYRLHFVPNQTKNIFIQYIYGTMNITFARTVETYKPEFILLYTKIKIYYFFIIQGLCFRKRTRFNHYKIKIPIANLTFLPKNSRFFNCNLWLLISNQLTIYSPMSTEVAYAEYMSILSIVQWQLPLKTLIRITPHCSHR